MPKRKTHDEYVAELAVKNPDVTVVGEYVNARTKIEHRCRCGKIWSVEPNTLLTRDSERGCKSCGDKKRGVARRKEHNQYVAEVAAKNPSVTVVGEYVSQDKKIALICANGHRWDALPDNVLRGGSCLKCSRSKKKTHSEYVAELRLKNPEIKVVGKYVNAREKVEHECAEGHRWKTSPSVTLKGHGCPHCSGWAKDHEDYCAELAMIGSNITPVQRYDGSHKKILHQCKKGHQWLTPPTHVLRGIGCPRCDRIASDANVFYIWENIQDPGVYKVGITSERLAENRIAKIAREPTISPSIILMASTPHARDIERRALELGDDPRYPDTIDGYTEFRRYSDAELGEVWRMAVSA